MSCGALSMSVNGEPTRVSHEFVKKNVVRYMRPHGRFAHCSCKNAALTLDFDLSTSAAGSRCIFTLGGRQSTVLASRIEIYYSRIVVQPNVIFPKHHLPERHFPEIVWSRTSFHYVILQILTVLFKRP